MDGRRGALVEILESGAYWLFYVVSVCGALLHWNSGNGLLAALCAFAAVSGALLIARTHPRPLAHG
ncbi:hypothetical protein IDM40_02660 [Nocardiopsis sp. HNM0947]|uniref:Uncharacterized protein n=1 Tax=Nocardiopsis coralli TaxID=2772213 RepID=A0ABR9P189_9ACTN|nr:hypothetical protein [Nocardiopsis coralli]MBE2997610.1 hypothetical protein [Nocardiopsis coralli]